MDYTEESRTFKQIDQQRKRPSQRRRLQPRRVYPFLGTGLNASAWRPLAACADAPWAAAYNRFDAVRREMLKFAHKLTQFASGMKVGGMDSEVLEFGSAHGVLRIVRSAANPGIVRAPGVHHLRYSVQGNGFSGTADGLVDERDLRRFFADLREILRGQSRSARWQAHPTRGGLSLEIRPGPDADTLAVVGYVATPHFRALTEADALYPWRTEFGFSMRRDALPNLGRVKWVSALAV